MIASGQFINIIQEDVLLEVACGSVLEKGHVLSPASNLDLGIYTHDIRSRPFLGARVSG
jgi:hypothetical protein